MFLAGSSFHGCQRSGDSQCRPVTSVAASGLWEQPGHTHIVWEFVGTHGEYEYEYVSTEPLTT